MLRKRDFLLFVIALVFLVLGIGLTLIYQGLTNSNSSLAPVGFTYAEISDTVISGEDDTNRVANIERLKNKIAAGEGQFTLPEVTKLAPLVATATSESMAVSRTWQKCSVLVDQSAVVSNWPKSRVVLKEIEGVRFVSEERLESNTVGTTTTSTLVEIPLLELLVSQIRGVSDQCIQGVVVGLTTAGALILNDEALNFSGFSSDTLIGYALDGLPIYGVTSEPDTLDQCGGKMETTGYRYYLRLNEDFVLGCFAGWPVEFPPAG